MYNQNPYPGTSLTIKFLWEAHCPPPHPFSGFTLIGAYIMVLNNGDVKSSQQIGQDRVLGTLIEIFLKCTFLLGWGRGGRGKRAGIFLWRHSSAGKQGESYVNQAVAKKDVNQNFVFVFNWSFFHITAHVQCEFARIFLRLDIYAFLGGYRTYSRRWEIPISAATNIKRKYKSLQICFFFFNRDLE